MFLPKSKYKGPFTAAGGDKELLYKDSLKPFRGQYFITYKKQVFEGEAPQYAGKELIFKNDYLVRKAREGKIELPKPFIPKPTDKDYTNKKFTRYFAKDKRNGRVFEIQKSDFAPTAKLPSMQTIKLEWWIDGPAKDTKYRGYIYYGAETRNRNTLQEAEKSMRGITNLLNNLSEFVL